MAIKASSLTQPTREMTCKVIVPDDEGTGVHEEEIRVVYRSLSVEWWRERRRGKDEGLGDLASLLADIVAELPDVLDDDGNPQPPTDDYLKGWLIENLRRVSTAIDEAMDPEKKSLSKSLPATSIPEEPKVEE